MKKRLIEKKIKELLKEREDIFMRMRGKHYTSVTGYDPYFMMIDSIDDRICFWREILSVS